ncbi:MAG: class II aldolase and adducin N-terminal domain-containing protein [Paracoccaceae bacterium]
MTAHHRPNLTHAEERADLAAAFRWTARLNMHEAVANHFSLAVNPEGTQFLINPFARHFARMKASDLLLLDANDPETLNRPGAPDPTAWGLHGSIHRRVPRAACVMHVHSVHATVLACLQDSRLPPLDQNACMFFGPRQVADPGFGGMAFESEGERCAGLLMDPRVKAMIMGNHGVLVIGRDVADAFNTLYYFERAAETYVRALQTGRPLRVLSDEVAEKTAQEWDDYPSTAGHFLSEIKALLDAGGEDFRN